MDDSLWHFTGSSVQDHHQEEEMEKGKKVVWGGLTTAVKRKEVKVKGEKERYIHLIAEYQRTEGEIRKISSVINAKMQKKTIEWERLEFSSRKLEIPREYFKQRCTQ